MTNPESVHIKSRFSGRTLYVAEGAADVREAVEEAVMSGASLRGANLRGANLAGAYLAGAYLAGANLVGANGINPHWFNDLLTLKDQPGPIRMYKLVNAKGEGPYNGGLVYKIGETVEVADANTDERLDCAAGVNLATLSWCMREWQPGYRILVAEFTRADIAAIPDASDGKFRVRRCRIVGEKDLVGIGLVAADEGETSP